MKTESPQYATRLLESESVWWKKLLNVQTPYRWNLNRLKPGFTLDIGCGLGRNLASMNGEGVGIDHNASSVAVARSRGLRAFTPGEFDHSTFNEPGTFDSILLSHVAEHMTEPEVISLVTRYIHLLRDGGQVILITPQEAGYRSDPSHVRFTDFIGLRKVARGAQLQVVREYSFPFPRVFGRVFKYNEFISVSRKACTKTSE